MTRINKDNWKNLVETALYLPEQNRRREEEEEARFQQIAQRVTDAMNQQLPQIPSPGPGVQDPFQMGEVTPLETGAPGAMSMDIGLETMAQAADAAQQPPMDMQQPPMDMQQPPMDMQQPPMDMMQPPMGMDMMQPPMDMQQPPMDMMQPPMGMDKPERPSFDSLPGMPPLPPQEEQPPMGGPPMGGPPMGGPPMGMQPPPPEQQEMKPSDDFGDRFGIPDESPRHYLRSTQPDVDTTTGPSMPFTPGPQAAEMGPQQGQEVPASLADQPSAPKQKPDEPPLTPGQTPGSQEFVTKYADAIKVQLKSIIDDEREKFARGQFMPQSVKTESYLYENSVNAMPPSPVVAGARAGYDKLLGTGDMERRASMQREEWLNYWR